MKRLYTVYIYENSGKVFIFPMSEVTTLGFFEELPSLKADYNAPAIEIGKLIIRASKSTRNNIFEKNPFNEQELLDDIGEKKWISFINKSRFCSLTMLEGSDELYISPGYRSAGGFEFGDRLVARPGDPQDIGEKVIEALQTFEPKFPKKRKP